MGRLAGFRYRQVTRRLRRLGFEFDRQARGSHETWWNPVTRRRTAVSLRVTLEQSRRRLPGATCMVCERLLRRARDEGADGRNLHIVVKLVFRMYRQHQDDEWPPRVLDLLDLLCLEGAMGATNEFERFER